MSQYATILHNDDITAPEFRALRASMANAVERLQTGLKYGEDMKSSAYVCAQDALNTIAGVLDQIA